MLVGNNKNRSKKTSSTSNTDGIFRKGSPIYIEMFNLMMDGTIKMGIRPGIIRESFLHWKNKYDINDFRVAFTRVRKDAYAEMERQGIRKYIFFVVDRCFFYFSLMTLTFF